MAVRAQPRLVLVLACVAFAFIAQACGSDDSSDTNDTTTDSGTSSHDASTDHAAHNDASSVDAKSDTAAADAAPGQDAQASKDAQSKDSAPAADTSTPVTTSKRGLAYGQNSAADIATMKAGISWWYNWALTPEVAPPAGVEFVPMVWGGGFTTAQLNGIPASAKVLLTFNEPNFGSQSHLTPAQAAALWPQIQAFADSRGMKIASPALNYCGGDCNETNPFTWLTSFFAACTNCRVDYIAAHWYACTKEALQSYLSDYKSRWDKPIWLTEFACLDDATITEAKEEAYMKDAVAILEADPKVFRYSWFTGRFDSQHAIDLLAGSGALTPLGQQYSTLPGHP